MKTRRILQIVFAVVCIAVVIVGGLIGYELLYPVSHTRLQNESGKAESAQQQNRRNPWASRHSQAIRLAGQLLDKSAVERLDSDQFVNSKLHLVDTERVGWRASWWGETEYGPSYYLLKYTFYDGAVQLGPEWLVDLQSDRIEPKNTAAKLVQNPDTDAGMPDIEGLIHRIARHQLGDKLHLAGALMVRWAQIQRQDPDTNIRLRGWRLEHTYGQRFNCYFMWKTGGESNHASFDFDRSSGAIRPSNLQANHIMGLESELKSTQKINIEPETYDRRQDSHIERWRGESKAKCVRADGRLRPACQALSMILSRRLLIENIEWYLSFKISEPGAFERCRRNKECRWVPESESGETFRVSYDYRVEGEDKSLEWRVNLESGAIEGTGPITRSAIRVIEPIWTKAD